MQRLALDVGTVRTGVAIGARVAREFGVLDSNNHLATKIAQIIAEEAIGELIVGMPQRSNGRDGTSARQINELIDTIKALCPDLIVETVDEAFSTKQAEIDLKQLGLNVAEAKRRVDAYSAMLILEQYNLGSPVQ